MDRQPGKQVLDKNAEHPRSPGSGVSGSPGSGVSGFLRQHKDAIVRSWETRVISEDHAIELTGLALRNDIPQLLEELAVWLASDAASETSLAAEKALAHVMQRLDAGLSLAQVLREYRLLRETLIEEVLRAEAAEQERAAASGKGGRFARIEELARLNAGLDVVLSQSIEQFVEERDRRAAAERASAAQNLKESNQQLVDSDRRKNHFLAVLSHELRNPLTPIKNSLYILDRAVPGGDQARRAKDVIERQINQLSHLVDDLLDVTRIARGKIQLQRRRVEINELVQRTIDDHRAVFQTADVRLEMEPAAQPVFVDADWNRTAQVVSNLLQNAAKFTLRGGRVLVTVERDAQAQQAVLRVADTGLGMKPEMVARLFEPFIQADETLDRSKGGLGLGLALIKGLVEQHGGSIEARSQGLDRGSEFIVRLPLDLSEPASDERAAAPVVGTRHRVLIIEDNVDAAQSLQEVLELLGHEVAVAHDGQEGLAKGREFRPDLVLCDIGLPGLNGYEVARAFRADDALRDVHLIALSGYARPEDLQRAAEAGFERHLAKPPSLEKLEGVLGQVSRSREKVRTLAD